MPPIKHNLASNKYKEHCTYNIIEIIALVLFFLLFPFQFFYTTAVSKNIIPPILGYGVEYFSIIAVIILMPPLMTRIITLRGSSLAITLLFFSLIVYIIIWFIIHLLLGDKIYQRTDILTQQIRLVGAWLSLFCIGFFWPQKLPKSYSKLIALSLFGMSLIIFLNLDWNNLVFSIDSAISADFTEKNVYNHQNFSRFFLFSALIFLSIKRNLFIFLTTSLIISVMILFIGARSEMIAFFSIAPLITYYLYRNYFFKIAILSTVVFCSGAIYFHDSLTNSRQSQIFAILESSSGIARLEMQEKALTAIAKSPIIGDFAGQVRDYGYTGSYAHNILSSWRQFGIIGFILYSSTLFGSFFLCLKKISENFQCKNKNLAIMALSFSSLSVLLLIVSKSVFWPFPAFAWGLTSAYLITTRQSLQHSTPK